MYYLEFTYFDGRKEALKDFTFEKRENAIAFAKEVIRLRFLMVGDEMINTLYIVRIRIMEEKE